MTSGTYPTDDIGDFVPFSRVGSKNESGWNDDEVMALKEVSIWVWATGGHDTPKDDENPNPDYAPENCILHVCGGYEGEFFDSAPLIDLIRANVDGSGCGPRAEMIALEKLRNEIAIIISELSAKAAE